MPNYTKLFNSIVTSTIWTEDDKTRIVWITMLAMSDQNGEVHASVPGLARVSGVSLYDCESALVKLSSPDAYSRTPDHEGRRISPIDGGWELLNHRKYRAMASREDEKKANADRQKRHRERNATVTDSNAAVTLCNDEVTESLHIVYTEADTEADIKPSTPQRAFTTDPESTPAGLVCARLRSEARISSVNPQHPKLLALLAAGMTADELVSAGMDANGKGFAWVLAAAEGRRRDAASVTGLPSARASPINGRRQTVAEEREAVSIALTGRKPNYERPIASTERDITGESTRVA